MRSTAPCFLARDRRRRCCSWLFLRRMRKAIFPHVPCGFSPPMVFFSHRYYSEFGVDLEQFDIFLSNSSCGIASAKRLSQSWQAGSATTRFFFVNFFSTFSGVRHAASVYVSSCFWIYDARDEGTATGSRVLWEEARRNGTVSVECAWFSARALQRRIRCSESASKVVFVFLSLFFGHGRDENFGSCIQ